MGHWGNGTLTLNAAGDCCFANRQVRCLVRLFAHAPAGLALTTRQLRVEKAILLRPPDQSCDSLVVIRRCVLRASHPNLVRGLVHPADSSACGLDGKVRGGNQNFISTSRDGLGTFTRHRNTPPRTEREYARMVATLEAVKLYLSRLLSRNAAPAVTACAGTAADLGAFDSPATALVMPLARARMRRGRAVLGKEVTLLTTLRHTPLSELDETVERLKV